MCSNADIASRDGVSDDDVADVKRILAKMPKTDEEE